MTVKIKDDKYIDWSEHPVVIQLQDKEPFLWFNPYKEDADLYKADLFTSEDLQDASDRLERFRPFFVEAFPETLETNGLDRKSVV